MVSPFGAEGIPAGWQSYYYCGGAVNLVSLFALRALPSPVGWLTTGVEQIVADCRKSGKLPSILCAIVVLMSLLIKSVHESSLVVVFFCTYK